ncbi:YpmS family protein [Isobaculum melis]|uniref:Uncharacterized protein YpmS n=1 Tax=Isobaculum melis TaxID=142588 RepID=A0A1H9RZB2_9LACT|nr:YpmS family protein [Isobaculum melis]SER77209.1 Uncharacterized protein YpmS [Isobaculum melis]
MEESRRTLKQKKRKDPTKKRNKWKIAFLFLVGILLIVTLWIGVSVFSKPATKDQSDLILKDATQVPFEIAANKVDINTVVAHYLEDFTKDSEIKYSLILDEQAELTGTFQIFGHDVSFSLFFDPYVTEDGNVQLKATHLAVGDLDLPISYVMNFVAKNYKIPSWVTVDSKEKTILLRLDKFSFNSGTQISAEKIDLKNNDIRLKVYLPLNQEVKATQ